MFFSGDFSINILAKDGPNPSVKSSVNDLTSIGCGSTINVVFPLDLLTIIKLSLRDHIYSNIFEKITTGGVCIEISYHLPTYCILLLSTPIVRTSIKRC